MKRPAMQFYPADYRNNANLRRCSWAAKGAWTEIMGLMHDSDEYGVLRWTLKEIAEAIGAPMKLLKELTDKGVLKGSEKDGDKVSFSTIITQKNQENLTVFLLKNEEIPLYFSSRMVRDEYIRNKRGANGHKSLENMNVPRKKEQDKVSFSTSNSTQDKDSSSPSPTSSTSFTTTVVDISDPNNIEEKLRNNDPLSLKARVRNFNQKLALGVTEISQQNFDRFRELYPKPGNWEEAQIAWVQKKCDAEAEIIFADVPKRKAEDAHWQETRFIPNPENYLKREVWKNAIVPKPKPTQATGSSAFSGKSIAQLKRERAEREAAEAAQQGVDRRSA